MIDHLSDEVLSAQLDGALDADEAARVTAHLAGCADCAHRLELLGATARAVSGLPDEPLPAALDLAFLAAPAATTDPLVLPVARRWRPPVWAAPVLAAAAVLLVAVSVAPGLLAHRGAATTASSGAGSLGLNQDRSAAQATPVAPVPGGAAPEGSQFQNPQFATTAGPHTARTFPQSGGVEVELAASQQATRAGQPVSLILTVRASSSSVQVQRTSVTMSRGTAAEQVLAGGSSTISPGRSSALSGTWDAGKIGTGPETPGDYLVSGSVVLADGSSLNVSLNLQVT